MEQQVAPPCPVVSREVRSPEVRGVGGLCAESTCQGAKTEYNLCKLRIVVNNALGPGAE